jgi:hypothetical protein
MADQAHNISAGTQVVSRVEVRGTNNSLVHPRDAVGVVTRTPATADFDQAAVSQSRFHLRQYTRW